jgi:hypothetical protein
VLIFLILRIRKSMALLKIGLLLVITWTVTSCAGVRTADPATSSKTSPFAKLPDLSDMPLARLLPSQRVKVVEVREKDLKELPSGKEKALLAARSHRNTRSNFWIFGGPVDFKEPALPEPGSEMDGSLLPPRMP